MAIRNAPYQRRDWMHAEQESPRMTHLLRPVLGCVFLALAATFSACRTASRAIDNDPRAETTVSVENQNFFDMTVYVLQNGRRIRLGIAPGHSTTVLTLPDYLVMAGSELQFLCDPIGTTRTPVSERITVFPGDQLVLIVNTGT
jgi:hypothetical protein